MDLLRCSKTTKNVCVCVCIDQKSSWFLPPQAFGEERKEVFLLSLFAVGSSEVLPLFLPSLEERDEKGTFLPFCFAALLCGYFAEGSENLTPR